MAAGGDAPPSKLSPVASDRQLPPQPRRCAGPLAGVGVPTGEGEHTAARGAPPGQEKEACPGPGPAGLLGCFSCSPILGPVTLASTIKVPSLSGTALGVICLDPQPARLVRRQEGPRLCYQNSFIRGSHHRRES